MALLSEIAARIRFSGPMTFGDYMRMCLTHPTHGYYMRNDVFGRRGDFITGPEISQTYGELVGVWCVAMWQQMGEPPAVRIVEAGPGRGTLMADMLRVISRHERLARGASIELIEVSPWMREKQRQVLCDPNGAATAERPRTRHGGMPVSWHTSLRDLLASGTPARAADQPDAEEHAEAEGGSGSRASQQPTRAAVPSIFVAHEFLDALPVHKFRRAPPARPGGPPGPWREVLVDVSDEAADEEEGAEQTAAGSGASAEQQQPPAGRAHGEQRAALGPPGAGAGSEQPRAASPLRFVLAPSATPALAVYAHLLPSSHAPPPPPSPPLPPSPPPPEPADGRAAAARQAAGVAAAAALVGAQPAAQGAGADGCGGVEVEVCPLALAFATDVASEISASGGAALFIDYGPATGPVADSARAIVKHAFVPLLHTPGEADLSALVDFGALQQAVAAVPGVALGCVATQRELLGALGLEARVNALLRSASKEEAAALIAAAHRLVAVPGMGDEYKAIAFCDARTGTPVGFRPAPAGLPARGPPAAQ